MSFFGGTINKLEQALNYSSLKNQAISNNIANIDTPGYKSQHVSFQNVLNSELKKPFIAKQTHSDHIEFSSPSLRSPRIFQQENTTYNHNGNNVDIDKEMTELAKNQILYESLIDRMSGKLRSLDMVIKGGR